MDPIQQIQKIPEVPYEDGGKPLSHSFIPALFFVLFLWIIEGIQYFTGYRLVFLGITARTTHGLIGIITAPFIHTNAEHLLSNSLPLLIVGTGIIHFYRSISFRVIGLIWLFTGFWVWLSARSEAHIGASGLIYGFVCFLFFSGLIRRDTRLMAISMLVTFLYGSMVWGILPVDQSISWESHMFGSVAGIFAAIYFRKDGPQRPKAQWEIDEENMADEAESGIVENFHDNVNESPSGPVINYEYKEDDTKKNMPHGPGET